MLQYSMIDYTIKHKFWSQRRSSRARGIDWNFTLEDWFDVWQTSGKFNARGRGKGTYVMARYNDTGPYEKGNVYITTFEQNNKDQHVYNKPKIGKHNSIKVLTPIGEFESMFKAREALDITYNEICKRLKHFPDEYKRL